ncbi:MAG: hypothetical protein M1820_005400 [Bogoriella megaspora]|nr:MAG: hypothetical protein M1820_005400 [Bogoriella megaspora]
MSILITGGTGKIGMPLAQMLQNAKIPFLLTSRKGLSGAPVGMQAVKFDWSDASTFDNAFNQAKIIAVFLVAPWSSSPAEMMNPFIDVAVQHGVKRFVMMAGTTVDKGGHYVGTVWQHLSDLKTETCVLRPSWFNENFLEEPHLSTIENEGKIYSGCEDGKSPYVATKDIVAVAFKALTDKTPPEESYYVIGEEILNNDEIAGLFTKVLGRKVEHIRMESQEENTKRLAKGQTEFIAYFMTWLEAETAKGLGEKIKTSDVRRVLGRPPQNFEDWVQENKTKWQ